MSRMFESAGSADCLACKGGGKRMEKENAWLQILRASELAQEHASMEGTFLRPHATTSECAFLHVPHIEYRGKRKGARSPPIAVHGPRPPAPRRSAAFSPLLTPPTCSVCLLLRLRED